MTHVSLYACHISCTYDDVIYIDADVSNMDVDSSLVTSADSSLTMLDELFAALEIL
jgi:hypothetical protein